MRAFHEQKDFKGLLLDDTDVCGVLSTAEIEKAFDLNEHFRNVDAIFERVFGRVGDFRLKAEATGQTL
jgi:adenylosuccinate lyase